MGGLPNLATAWWPWASPLTSPREIIRGHWVGVTINPLFIKEQKKCLLLSPGTSRCKTELLCGARRQRVPPSRPVSPGPWDLRALGLADLVAPKGQRGGQTAPKVSDARSAGSRVEP